MIPIKRLILVEGLPGTGKTTIIEWIANRLPEKGEHVNLLFEGDSHIPCDFYETAGIPQAAFDEICNNNPESAADLNKQALYAEDYVFLRIDESPACVQSILRRWDMGDEKNQMVTVTDYVPCAMARIKHWVQSVKNECGTTLIDSGFLQNPINELLFRGATDHQVETFIREIAIEFEPLHPFCVYLYRNSAKEALSFAEHVKGKEWAERVQDLLRQSGQENLFERRFKLEMRLLTAELLPHICCEIKSDDWSYAKEYISRLLINKDILCKN